MYRYKTFLHLSTRNKIPVSIDMKLLILYSKPIPQGTTAGIFIRKVLGKRKKMTQIVGTYDIHLKLVNYELLPVPGTVYSVN